MIWKRKPSRRRPAGKSTFTTDPERRDALLEGLDEIGMTLKLDAQIRAHQIRDRESRPWIYRREETARVARLLFWLVTVSVQKSLPRYGASLNGSSPSGNLPSTCAKSSSAFPRGRRMASSCAKQTWDEIVAADAILFGAIGSPEYDKVPAEARKVDQLLRMRKELDLFCNLRPVRTLPALGASSSLRPEVIAGCDMMIVRELCGGIYFGEPRGREKLGSGGERAVNTCIYTTAEVERIARAAFDLARTRSGRVCSVDKSNVLTETGGLWRDTVQALRDRHYPDIELSHMYVDNCAMQLVRAPKQFDVLVTENLFGDILSDCAAMVAGSLGMLPSASLGPCDPMAVVTPYMSQSTEVPPTSPAKASPIHWVRSELRVCLRFSLGIAQEADRLERAIDAAISHGARTADIAQPGDKTSQPKPWAMRCSRSWNKCNDDYKSRDLVAVD